MQSGVSDNASNQGPEKIAVEVSSATSGKIAREGPGHFQWNGGAWAGGQIGGSCWLLPSAALLATRSVLVGGIFLLAFLVINGVGLFLYSQRDRYLPYPCIQALLLTIGVCGTLAWTSLVALRRDLLPLMQANSIWIGYICMLIVPGIMLQFHFQESYPKGIRRAEDIEKVESGD